MVNLRVTLGRLAFDVETEVGKPSRWITLRALRVLDQHQASYQYIDIEADDVARSYVEQVNRGYRSVPTILFPDGSVLVEPSSAALAQKLAALDS